MHLQVAKMVNCMLHIFLPRLKKSTEKSEQFHIAACEWSEVSEIEDEDGAILGGIIKAGL